MEKRPQVEEQKQVKAPKRENKTDPLGE